MKIHYLLLFITFILLFIIRAQNQGGLEKELANPLEEYSQGFEGKREELSGLTKEILPETQAALLSGMLFGVKEEMPKEFNQALRNTSTIHMVVVSGQNLSMLAGFILVLKGYLGRRKTILLSVGVVILYSFLTGLGIPVIRAAIMVILSSVAQVFGREGDSVYILFLTAALMLIFDPNWLLSLSFQLSFLATLGVVALAPEVIKKLKFMPEILKQDFGIALSAQALTWPIIAANFHTFSIVGVLANSFVTWSVPLIMISGIVAIIAHVIFPLFGSLTAYLPLTLLSYFITMVNFFNQKGSTLYMGKVNILVWAGYYLIIFALYLIIKKSNNRADLV